jgi:hypothetical protein
MHQTARQRGRGRPAARLAAACGLAATLAATLAAAPPPATGLDADPAQVRFYAAPTPNHWDPLTDALWSFEGEEVVLTRAGTNPGPPRRPFEYAIVTHGPELTSVEVTADVRLDEPVSVNNRDVILVWNYQSPTRFYYAHISQDNTIYAHNGIFVVNDADRLRIDDQWNGSVGAPPQVHDAEWHDVRLDYDAVTGEIAVYVDDSAEPMMTATDTTFTGGRVGFGSFDNYGRTRHFRVLGTPR